MTERTLEAVVREYIDEHEYGIADTTQGFLRACVMCYRAFLGRDPITADLTRDNFNRYINWMSQHRAASTARSQRGGLLTIWRYAAELEEAEMPRKLRKVRKPRLVVSTWTPDEISKLRDHCLKMSGTLANGLGKGLYFGSLVAASYETGFRRSDQLSLERDWIRDMRGEGHLTIIEHKTGKEARRVLSLTTMQMIDNLMTQQPNRKLIWPLWKSMDAWSRMFSRIVRSAPVRPGSFKYLRRSCATAIEIAKTGEAQFFLNHSDSRVTNESYLDQSQVRPMPLRVPPLPADLLAEYLSTPYRDPPQQRQTG